MNNDRRYRGILGLAVTWGAALSALATGLLVLGLETGLVPSSVFGVRELVALAVRGVVAGGIAGGLFGWLLSTREVGQTLSTMSMRRVALWGFVSAGTLPIIMTLAAAGPVVPLSVLIAGTAAFGGLGSVLSTATLRIARRAEARLRASGDGVSLLP